MLHQPQWERGKLGYADLQVVFNVIWECIHLLAHEQGHEKSAGWQGFMPGFDAKDKACMVDSVGRWMQNLEARELSTLYGWAFRDTNLQVRKIVYDVMPRAAFWFPLPKGVDADYDDYMDWKEHCFPATAWVLQPCSSAHDLAAEAALHQHILREFPALP